MAVQAVVTVVRMTSRRLLHKLTSDDELGEVRTLAGRACQCALVLQLYVGYVGRRPFLVLGRVVVSLCTVVQ